MEGGTLARRCHLLHDWHCAPATPTRQRACFANAIVVAYLDGGGLLLLLWPFWIQSVVIGVYAQRRILVLQRFTTGADAASKLEVTNADTGRASLVAMGNLGGIDLLIILALGVGFWQSHRASHLEHVAADLRGRPNIGTLMFLPYARIVPMHITTIADVIMHKVEHHLLQQSAGSTG